MICFNEQFPVSVLYWDFFFPSEKFLYISFQKNAQNRRKKRIVVEMGSMEPANFYSNWINFMQQIYTVNITMIV